MIVRIELLQKAAGLSHAEFSRHWLGRPAELAARLQGLRRHEQHHVIDQLQRGIDYQRGPEQPDGFAMFWFDDEAAMHTAFASDAGKALDDALAACCSTRRALVIEQLEVIPPASDGALIKRMSTLRRRADVLPEVFRHEWRDEHARLVKRIQGVRGYRQNHVLAREAPAGHPVNHAGWPIDGIVELWFDDAASLDAAFASPQGATLMMHAREFIAEITTFLVEPHLIV